MCGIVGAVGLSGPPDQELVDTILGALRHRGPDAWGTWCEADRWLGFRRLSVLDLSDRANQPMQDAQRGVAVVFNGEIYNYLELRHELEARGHRFETTGDTEVVLRGYLAWGRSLFSRCNGMWAVGIVDPEVDGVLLCRDRFGEKPLHVGRRPDGSWWFASEVAALHAAGVGGGRLDTSRAAAFLLYGDAEDPARSYIEGITQIPPGHTARLTSSGLADVRAWFDVDSFVAEAWDSRGALDEEVRAAIDDAVQLRLRSDVEVGTSLSGGVDSSAVVASVRALDAGRRVHSFTASFPGQDIDEWDLATLVGRDLDLVMHRVEPTVEGFLDDIGLLIDRQGGPIESPTVYAQWCVMRAARENDVTVLLDGQGADESWGGYLKYLWLGLVEELFALHPVDAFSTFRRWWQIADLPRPHARQLAGAVVPARLRPAMLRLATGPTRQFLGPAVRDAAPADLLGPRVGVSMLGDAAIDDLRRVVLPRLLRYADRNSMAWSIEVRLPFLDPTVLKLALGSSWSAGLRNGWAKYALRQAVAPRLPVEIAWRRAKVAYEVPEHTWLSDGRVAAAVSEAHRELVNAGILATGSEEGRRLQPWRVLSLWRFIDRYGLGA